MAKHLMIGSGPSNFKLPADEDIEVLWRRVKECMENGTVIEIRVDLDTSFGTVLLNGAAADTALIVDL